MKGNGRETRERRQRRRTDKAGTHQLSKLVNINTKDKRERKYKKTVIIRIELIQYEIKDQ